jgi:hypothetical protein
VAADGHHRDDQAVGRNVTTIAKHFIADFATRVTSIRTLPVGALSAMRAPWRSN